MKFRILINKNTCIYNLNKWRPIPRSWMGQHNIIKMLILPKLVYKFKTVTINFPNGILKEFYKHALYFTWRKETWKNPVWGTLDFHTQWLLSAGDRTGGLRTFGSTLSFTRYTAAALWKLEQGIGQREVSCGINTGRGWRPTWTPHSRESSHG